MERPTVPVRDTPHLKESVRRCRACAEWFLPPRPDAVYCGDACRQAAHRAK